VAVHVHYLDDDLDPAAYSSRFLYLHIMYCTLNRSGLHAAATFCWFSAAFLSKQTPAEQVTPAAWQHNIPLYQNPGYKIIVHLHVVLNLVITDGRMLQFVATLN
jgi:hypothetical protein